MANLQLLLPLHHPLWQPRRLRKIVERDVLGRQPQHSPPRDLSLSTGRRVFVRGTRDATALRIRMRAAMSRTHCSATVKMAAARLGVTGVSLPSRRKLQVCEWIDAESSSTPTLPELELKSYASFKCFSTCKASTTALKRDDTKLLILPWLCPSTFYVVKAISQPFPSGGLELNLAFSGPKSMP